MRPLHGLYDTGCATCWRLLINELVSNAAMGFELIDFDEAARAGDEIDYQPDPLRQNHVIALVTRLLATALDTAR